MIGGDARGGELQVGVRHGGIGRRHGQGGCQQRCDHVHLPVPAASVRRARRGVQ